MIRRITFLLLITAFVFSFTGTAYASVSGATPSQTSYATLLTLIISCIFIIFCVTLVLRSSGDYKSGWFLFLAAAVVAIVVRVSIAKYYPGYRTDMICFSAWADAMYTYGPSGFYGSLGFADYPPGYMYILWVVGFFHNLLGINASADYTTLLKLPAIISEVVIAAIVYSIASKAAGKRYGLLCSCLILFNPALFFNSSVWGQIDPVFALFIVVSLYWLKKENYLAGAFFFAIALLVKPQAIMFAPVVGLAYVYALFKHGGLKKALIGMSGGLIIVVGLLFLGALPFNTYQPQTPFAMETGDYIVNFEGYDESKEPYEIKYVKYYASGEGSFSLSYGDENGGGIPVTVKPSDGGEEAPFKAQISASGPEWRQAEVAGFSTSNIDIHVDEPGINMYEIAFYGSNGIAAPVDDKVPVHRLTPGNDIPKNMLDEQLYPQVHGLNMVRWIINKYIGTVGSYPYATLNAFNLFALLGGNWTPDTETLLLCSYKIWGMIFLVIICAAVAFMQWRTRERRPYFDISAFLIISLFMLMHMVHERYMVPACVLLVFAYAYSRDTATLVFAGLWSVSVMFNQMVVLYADTSAAPEGPLMVLSAINVALYAVYAVITIRKLLSGKVIIKSPALHG